MKTIKPGFLFPGAGPLLAATLLLAISHGHSQERVFAKPDLLPLNCSQPTEITVIWQAYREFYGISLPEETQFYAGWVDCSDEKIAVQIFAQKTPKATVLLVHGYFDHTGLMAPLIDYLVQKNYTVISMDLPGHGLSTGKRADIDDFAQYGEAVWAVINAWTHEPISTKPLFAIGHSTGCSALIEYLYRDKKPIDNEEYLFADERFSQLDKIVFLAPLVRSAVWYPSKFINLIGRGFLDHTKRWYRNSTSKPGYASFQKKDPLGTNTFPVSWSTALISWEKKFTDYPTGTWPILIIQGTKDTVVDFSHNVPFLKKKMAARVEYIKGAKHLLINETPEYRDTVFNEADLYFNEN